MIKIFQSPTLIGLTIVLVILLNLFVMSPAWTLFFGDALHAIKGALLALISAGLVCIVAAVGLALCKSSATFESCNCRYTDLGDSHEYTKFDDNNEMEYTFEESHNYDDHGVCINCGHEHKE